MQPFKNIQVDGWAALPNIFCHGPAHFTALNKVFFLMLCRHSTTFKWTAGRAAPNTVQFISRCWVNFLSGWREAFQNHSKLRLGRAPPNTAQFLPRCWRTFSSGCYAAISKIFKLMAGPRFPTSPVTAQLISFWCYADFQQRSNERLVVLPQTRSSSNHAVVSTFRPDGVKLFRNIQILGWVVLPQTRPSSFHGVEKLFRLDVMQPFQNYSSWWLSCAPQHPCHGPAHFAAFNILVVLMLCRLSTTFKWTAGRAPPNTVQLISRC